MIGFFTVNGKSCKDYNMVCSDAKIHNIAEKDVDTIQVPGRNGDLVISNNRYENVPLVYPTVIMKNFIENFSYFVNYIQSFDGYVRIEDTFKTDEFYMARYKGETSPKKMALDNSGVFEVEFERKPQRWLKSGEEKHVFTSNGSIENPTFMTAKPLVRVYGTGTVGIGSNTIRIDTNQSYIDIDCEIENAYRGTTNCNGDITLGGNDFWNIPKGVSGVALGTGITRVEITPRWWRL